MLAFQPKEENELIDLLEVGEGSYEVTQAEEKHSKNGNPMIKLTLKVWDGNGRQGVIFDYLMLTEENYSLRKIKHFCFSCGLSDFYKQGQLAAEDCVGRTGDLKIGFQKDKTGQYPDKNIVVDYLDRTKFDVSVATTEPDFKDDDIPF